MSDHTPSNKRVLVTNCSDGMFWYRDHIGESFIFLYDSRASEEFVVLSSDGYTNIVKHSDGKLITKEN